MAHQFSKTPLLILFGISLVPIVLIDLPPNIWAYSNILVIIFFSLWAYSITKVLFGKNNYDKNIKFGKFLCLLAFTDVYTIALSIYYSLTYNNYEDPKWLLLLIIIGHFLLLYSIYFLINFISKVLSTIELQRTVTFKDYFGYFLMLFFFPIGIWWLYPKLQIAAKR